MKKRTNSLVKLHIAVFMFGFAALFGKLLDFSPVVIVFGRTVFAALTLFLILLFSKQNFKLKSKKDLLILFSIGIIFAIHWFAFFKSVQVSNVAIAVLTFSTFPIFVTFLEPFFFKEKLKMFDILIALITLLGVSLIVPKFEITNNSTQGALWGVAAGFTCAIMAIVTRRNIQRYSSVLISFYQNLSGALVVMPFVVFYIKPGLHLRDVLLLILLGVVFTAITSILFISSLAHIKAQLVSVITCLEPVYAIVFAAILLKEVPTFKTLLGGLVILGAVLSATYKAKKKDILLEY